MRLMPVISAALVLSMSHLSFAQEWIEFASRDDRFTCLFPSQPKITETSYLSPHEADLPARYPEPGLFQQSLGWLDENAIGLRYQFVYINEAIFINGVPAPPRVDRTIQPGQGRIDAPGATPGQANQGR